MLFVLLAFRAGIAGIHAYLLYSMSIVTMELPRLIALSGALKDQSFAVDENGVRVSEDCIVRLCDGRAVAYSLRQDARPGRGVFGP